MTLPPDASSVPPDPSASRRTPGGLPLWSWIALAVALVVGVVGSAVLGAGLGAAAGREVRSVPDGWLPGGGPSGPGGSGDEPTRALPSTPTPTSPSGPGAADVVSLDEHVDLGGGQPVVWAVPLPSGWTPEVVDQGGVNRFVDPATRCSFTSSQNQQPAADTAAMSDRADTEATQALIEQGFTSSTAGATVRGLEPVVVDASTASGDARGVELLTSRFDYPLPATGEAWTNRLAVRAMPEMSAMVYLVANCPTTVAESGDDPWAGLVERVRLLPAA